MLDHPASTATFLSGLGLGGKAPALPSIFQAGDRIFDAAGDLAAIPLGTKHGLTSTLVAFREGDTLRIDSWLMSCRIFSRSAEQFVLRGLIGVAAEMGVRRVVGEYLPTAKNDVVADLYPRLGFSAVGESLFKRKVEDGVGDLVTFVTDAG